MQRRKRVSVPLVVSLAGAVLSVSPVPAANTAWANAVGLPYTPHMAEGSPPPELRLRTIVVRAIDDSVATWSRIMSERSVEVAEVGVQFLSRLSPSNCYGLYAGDGPAYCSGNRTVFIGTAAASRLMAKFGAQAEAGITFLVGHEIGHHIQNIDGRFQALSRAIYSSPEHGPDFVRRFELQADCLAGVWIHDSQAWAHSEAFRADMIAVLSDIGDDKLMADQPPDKVRRVGLHGTTEQRTRWFLRGVNSGMPESCDTFSVPQP